MNLLEGIQKKNTIYNTKGGMYYDTTFDDNLDLFSMVSRFDTDERILQLFDNAFYENKELALANLLYLLDIRNGRGERRIFQIIYKNLCLYHKEEALLIMPFIGEFGRYDYLLLGLDTKIENESLEFIQRQLEIDLKSDTPSLLAKWLPSHRSHGVNSLTAKKIITYMGITEKEYRLLLKKLRSKINLVETNLTTRNYSKIEFDKVPSKAMLKYHKSFEKNMTSSFHTYKKEVLDGIRSIHTTGLFAYEIIQKILNREGDSELYNLMWDNQKNVIPDCKKNLLVVADTSASMMTHGAIPYCTSVGMAIYIAERNQGFFHNYFITFSDEPTLHEVKGRTIQDKVLNMREINVWNTDIDKVFELILTTSLENNLSQEDLPETVLIISDMEFDRGVYSRNGTNFSGWKEAFEKAGYSLPSILFWNVAGNSRGVPVTKIDQNVAIVSGFSTNVLEKLFTLDEYSPISLMWERLSLYLELIKVG